MAKIETDGKFPKRIGDLVLYRWEDKVVLKTVSGFTSEELKRAPKYEASRQTAKEFGLLSSSCKKLRMALASMLPKQNNRAVVNAFNKKMREILNCDTTNLRGSRNLAMALATEEGKQLLTGYEFNPDASINPGWSLQEGSLSINAVGLPFPAKAKGIGFRVHQLVFDFATGNSALVSREWVYGSEQTDLALPALPGATGIVFTILESQFYNNAGGVDAAMEAGEGKSVLIVGIG